MVKIIVFLLLFSNCFKAKVNEKDESPPDSLKHCFALGQNFTWVDYQQMKTGAADEESDSQWSVHFLDDKLDGRLGLHINSAIRIYWEGRPDNPFFKGKKIKPTLKVGDIILKIDECSFTEFDRTKGMYWLYPESNLISLFSLVLYHDYEHVKKHIKTIEVIRNGKKKILDVSKIY